MAKEIVYDVYSAGKHVGVLTASPLAAMEWSMGNGCKIVAQNADFNEDVKHIADIMKEAEPLKLHLSDNADKKDSDNDG